MPGEPKLLAMFTLIPKSKFGTGKFKGSPAGDYHTVLTQTTNFMA